MNPICGKAKQKFPTSLSPNGNFYMLIFNDTAKLLIHMLSSQESIRVLFLLLNMALFDCCINKKLKGFHHLEVNKFILQNVLTYYT